MWIWMLFEAVWLCCSCGDREGAATLLSAHTCTWAALRETTSARPARGAWVRRCVSTRR
jgi:hypothetical protein